MQVWFIAILGDGNYCMSHLNLQTSVWFIAMLMPCESMMNMECFCLCIFTFYKLHSSRWQIKDWDDNFPYDRRQEIVKTVYIFFSVPLVTHFTRSWTFPKLPLQRMWRRLTGDWHLSIILTKIPTILKQPKRWGWLCASCDYFKCT